MTGAENRGAKNRTLAAVLAFLLVAGQLAVIRPVRTEAAGGDIPVDLVIDGEVLRTEDKAVLSHGRTLVPIRVLMESLGARVEWLPETRSVTVTRESGTAVKLWIDNRLICYSAGGGSEYDVCDVAPRIIADRTYVPLRLVAGALGISLEWDGQNGRVLVDTAKAGERSRFFGLSIAGIQPGQPVKGGIPLSLSYGGGLPQGAARVKYLFLDPLTGRGKILANTADAGGAVTLLPDLTQRGAGILAAVVCDGAGEFLAGAALGVDMQPTPEVSLLGLRQGQVMAGEIQMQTGLNFIAGSVEYEFTHLESGGSTRSAPGDPTGVYTHTPPAGQSGAVSVRAVAYDTAGNAYPSEAVTIQAEVPPADLGPQVTLHSFNADNVGKIPVTLSVSRNFDALVTQYWARNIAGGEPVLLAEKPWGDYAWFPGPEMAGTWDVYAKVSDTAGRIHTSNPRRATVSPLPGILLRGVGPGQVITGEIKFHSLANVPVQHVEYMLSNPFNGSSRKLGESADLAQEIAWTPESVNEGERSIQAVGVLAGGQTVSSEAVKVKVYLGPLHSARAVTEKDKFVELVTPMALETQKQNGMSAALQVAQAILETGWGQSLPVDMYSGLFSNNLFGIKGSGPAGSVLSATREEYYGAMYRVDANFRAYHNVRESWDDHNKLLLDAERYRPYREVMYHSAAGAYALKRCGYATDSAYPDKLIAIIRQYGLDQLDSQGL